ncbi:MAG: hypothetical protein JW789_03280 [Candidatus Aenigmarchaeota archaeon]|nr:hypothetical protein [Candidatus Aenigmarchaeota archaeon]
MKKTYEIVIKGHCYNGSNSGAVIVHPLKIEYDEEITLDNVFDAIKEYHEAAEKQGVRPLSKEIIIEFRSNNVSE